MTSEPNCNEKSFPNFYPVSRGRGRGGVRERDREVTEGLDATSVEVPCSQFLFDCSHWNVLVQW